MLLSCNHMNTLLTIHGDVVGEGRLSPIFVGLDVLVSQVVRHAFEVLVQTTRRH